ncbi:MAG: PIN domain-containing protein [Methanothrix sp.]|nr:PIN domain-containing protein [Methanothrix sp.]
MLETFPELVTSATVIHELIYVSIRDLCEERYGTRNNSSYRKIIATKGYAPFRKDIDRLFQFVENSSVSLIPVNNDLEEWKEILLKYKLLPYDALIAATCMSNGITKIATFDRDFNRVDFLKIVDMI